MWVFLPPALCRGCGRQAECGGCGGCYPPVTPLMGRSAPSAPARAAAMRGHKRGGRWAPGWPRHWCPGGAQTSNTAFERGCGQRVPPAARGRAAPGRAMGGRHGTVGRRRARARAPAPAPCSGPAPCTSGPGLRGRGRPHPCGAPGGWWSQGVRGCARASRLRRPRGHRGGMWGLCPCENRSCGIAGPLLRTPHLGSVWGLGGEGREGSSPAQSRDSPGPRWKPRCVRARPSGSGNPPGPSGNLRRSQSSALRASPSVVCHPGGLGWDAPGEPTWDLAVPAWLAPPPFSPPPLAAPRVLGPISPRAEPGRSHDPMV